jgi:hypothetical protein
MRSFADLFLYFGFNLAAFTTPIEEANTVRAACCARRTRWISSGTSSSPAACPDPYLPAVRL